MSVDNKSEVILDKKLFKPPGASAYKCFALLNLIFP